MRESERLPLERALLAAADALDAALADARAAHRQYGRLVDADRTWSRLDAAVTDEIRRRRGDVALNAAASLATALREEARAAATRYPDVDADGARLPPRPASDDPVVVRDWWAGLPPQSREQVLAEETAWVGSADGLPAPVRHAANLQLLEAEIERRTAITAVLAAPAGPELTAGPEPTGGPEAAAEAGVLLPDEPRDAARVEEERDLRGLLRLREYLAGAPDGSTQDTAGRPNPDASADQRWLYLLDATAYPLKAAVVLGDLQTADIVVLHVPGATTSVDLRLRREVQWLSALRSEAARLAQGVHAGQTVAVVDWIGYHAPYDIATRRALGDSGVSVFVPGEANDPRYAREAAPVLARCAQGLRALCPRPTRLVASGHSYGASVVGLALRQTDAFDAAVVAGAPGLFTARAAELRLPPGRLYAAVAPGDLIAWLGVFGGQVVAVEGITLLSPFARRVGYPDGGKQLLRPVWGHESYYQPGSATLHAIAAAVVGADDALRTISRRAIDLALRRGSASPADATANTPANSPASAADDPTVDPKLTASAESGRGGRDDSAGAR